MLVFPVREQAENSVHKESSNSKCVRRTGMGGDFCIVIAADGIAIIVL